MSRQKTRKIILLFSMLFFPITINYFSPYLIVQGSFAGIASGSLLLFAGLFLSSLLFGRVFCGWVCPAGALQDVCNTIVDKRTARKQNRIKYLIWVPWLLAIIAGFVSAGGLKQVNAVYYTDYGISVSAPAGYVVYFGVVFLIVGVSLVFGRRSFCHSVCWMAPFMVIGNAIRSSLGLSGLRLKAYPNRCVSCKLCTKICPMSLNVTEMVRADRMLDPECILCGSCADVCPKDAIRMGLGKVV